MAMPTENWPKPWVFQVHEQAVEHGFVWVEPISEADAASLKSRAYRMRRRGDKSMAAFIRPEYHLVMIGQWEAGPDGTGRLPFIYNKRPDGVELPNIRPAEPSEVSTYVPPPRVPAPKIDPDTLQFSPDELTMKPEEIGGFVEQMRSKAKERRS